MPAYMPGINSGARSIAGPVDLDNDGQVEVVLSDYSGGGASARARKCWHRYLGVDLFLSAIRGYFRNFK